MVCPSNGLPNSFRQKKIKNRKWDKLFRTRFILFVLFIPWYGSINTIHIHIFLNDEIKLYFGIRMTMANGKWMAMYKWMTSTAIRKWKFTIFDIQEFRYWPTVICLGAIYFYTNGYRSVALKWCNWIENSFLSCSTSRCVPRARRACELQLNNRVAIKK